MAIIAQDNFTRANSTTTMGTAPTGQVWQKSGTQTWGIQNNLAYPVTPLWDEPTFLRITATNMVAYQVRIATYHSQNQIMWRISGTTGQNYFVLQGSTLYRSVSGSWVELQTGLTFASGDTFRVEINGSTHTIKRNGTIIHTFSDNAHLSGNGYGFSANSTTARFDDVLIEDLVIPDTTPPAPVTNVTHYADQNNATVSWTNPTDADFDYVRVSRNGTIISAQNKIGQIADTGLLAGTTYTYELRSVDKTGNVGTAVTYTVTTPDFPTANITEDFMDANYNFTITTTGATAWLRSTYAYDFNPNYPGYLMSTSVPATANIKLNVPKGMNSRVELEWAGEKDVLGTHRILLNGTVLKTMTEPYFKAERLVANLPAGVNNLDIQVESTGSSGGNFYLFEVRLINEALAVPPATVSNVVGTSTTNSVTLNWTNPVDANFHHVEILRNGVSIHHATASSTSYVDTGLQADTSYTYVIRSHGSTHVYNGGQQVVVATKKLIVKMGEFRARTGEQIPIYEIAGDPTQPLRIRTSEGTGFIRLVLVTDPKASRIRHHSSKGLRAWEGVTATTSLIINGGLFTDSLFTRTFDGGSFTNATFTTVIDGGTFI